MAHRVRLLIQSFVETGSLRTHLAAFQNASAELQSDVLTCWRTNVEEALGIVPHMRVCSQTSLGLSGQVQLVQHGGYQMGSLHYTDSIGGPNINSSQCMKASHGSTCFFLQDTVELWRWKAEIESAKPPTGSVGKHTRTLYPSFLHTPSKG